MTEYYIGSWTNFSASYVVGSTDREAGMQKADRFSSLREVAQKLIELTRTRDMSGFYVGSVKEGSAYLTVGTMIRLTQAEQSQLKRHLETIRSENRSDPRSIPSRPFSVYTGNTAADTIYEEQRPS